MYKQCPNCGVAWERWQDLLDDPEIALLGYQVNFSQLDTGIILFNHICKGTLALHAADFMDLHDGPIFTQRAKGSDQCGEHCLHEDDFRPCPATCECAYVRNVLHKISVWPKCQDGLEASPA